MKLLELKHSPEFGKEFGPTTKFSKVYGNYCGRGNRGGNPIDAIDAACKNHDECYHYKGKGDCDCDSKLIKTLDELLNTKLSFRQRVAAFAIRGYFKRRGK